MGADALRTNGVTQKLLYFLRDDALVPTTEPLRRVRRSRLALFVGVELLGFAGTFAVTQTIAAIGFPVIICLLVPVRMWVLPRMPFTAEELAILDGPTASPFVSAFLAFVCLWGVVAERLCVDDGVRGGFVVIGARVLSVWHKAIDENATSSLMLSRRDRIEMGAPF
jgi:hypothetical protein